MGCGSSRSQRSPRPTKSKLDHRLSYARTRSATSGGELFTRKSLDRRRQAIKRGRVAPHDPLTLIRGEPPDLPVRRVVTPVRVVGGEHQAIAEIHHLQVVAVHPDVDILER